MKREGLAIPGYAFDKDDKLVRSTKRLSVSERIRRKKSKRMKPVGGKRPPE